MASWWEILEGQVPSTIQIHYNQMKSRYHSVLLSIEVQVNGKVGQKYTTSFFIWIVGFMWDITIFEILCGINVGLYVKSLCVER